MMPDINNRIQALITQRGRSGNNIVDYSLHDYGDGQGPVIGKWDEAKLGARPTYEELAAVVISEPTRMELIEVALSQVGVTLEEAKQELEQAAP